MGIEDLITQINGLNKEGIMLTQSAEQDRYSLAIKKHEEALELAGKAGSSINPDHYAVSKANIAYAMRQRDNDSSKVLRFLEDALGHAEEGFADRNVKSYFGRARIIEEKALVFRYDKDRTLIKLKQGLELIQDSITLYGEALLNKGNEIAEDSAIRDRMYRSTGIASAIAVEIADGLSGKEKKRCILTALGFACKELLDRLGAGERDGSSLMNSYHTVGAVMTELAEGKDDHYERAKNNLSKAKELANSAMMKSVLDLRFAWLEYRAGGDNTFRIRTCIDKVLAGQENPASAWSAAVRDVLKKKMAVLGNHLGGEYAGKVEQMYK